MPKDYHNDNKSFIIYKDWEEYVDALGSDEEAGKLFKALFAFAKRAEEAEFVGALKMAFIIMRNSIERDGEKWENTCSARSDAGKKAADPQKQVIFQKTKQKQKKLIKIQKQILILKKKYIHPLPPQKGRTARKLSVKIKARA